MSGRRARLDVVLTGGGTGGHVEPALALARALEAAGHERAALHFVGGRRGSEGRVVSEAGYSITRLPGRGVRRRLTLSNVAALAGLGLALVEAIALLTLRRPRVVVTFGGYAGLPAAVAAVLLRIPLLVVNVDAVPSASNRLVARFARRCAVAFPAPLPHAVLTGAPLREAVLAAAGEPPEVARATFDIAPGRQVVVVVGGSLGAGRLNTAAIGLARLLAGRADLVLVHICGERNYAALTAELAAQPLGEVAIDYRLLPYESRLPALFRGAALVVSRAGANTVAELAAIGVASVLVPLPNAPSDHQRRNAAELERVGGAIVLRDDEVTAERLCELLVPLLEEPGKLAAMADAAHSVARLDATERIARLVDEVGAFEAVAA